MKKSGFILPDSPCGKEIGFTSDKFHPVSRLWRGPGKIVVFLIATKTKGAGHFRALVQTIRKRGLSVVIQDPQGEMEEIVRKNKYVQTFEKEFIPFPGDPKWVSAMRSKIHKTENWTLPPIKF